MSAQDGGLIMPRFNNPQPKAEAGNPIGWCNQCVGEAKQSIADGNHEALPVHAAVTMVGRLQVFQHPQMGAVPAVIVVPVCWDHIVIAPKVTGLVTGGPGVPGA